MFNFPRNYQTISKVVAPGFPPMTDLVPATPKPHLPPVSVASCTILKKLTPAAAPTPGVSRGPLNEAELSLCGLLRLIPRANG